MTLLDDIRMLRLLYKKCEDYEAVNQVNEIANQVKQRGDLSIKRFEEEFSGISIENLAEENPVPLGEAYQKIAKLQSSMNHSTEGFTFHFASMDEYRAKLDYFDGWGNALGDYTHKKKSNSYEKERVKVMLRGREFEHYIEVRSESGFLVADTLEKLIEARGE